MARQLRDSVVVITGASSGIGRAAAHAFARRGANVVVAARRDYALRSLVDECERMGGRALAVPTDVTDEQAVRALARAAVERFGRLDTWVNNAGVYLAGAFEDTPPEAFRRVIETNFFGYVHGARAALAEFRKQGGGVLINNASIDARLAAPRFSAYTSSKWAVLSLSRTLRQELRGSGIEVCTLLPAAIDTPIFQHGANYTGRAMKALNPVYAAERVGEAMVSLAERPRREVTVGGAGLMLTLMGTLVPPLADRMMARQLDMDHFRDEPQPPTDGILFQPEPRWSGVSGEWGQTGELPLGRIAAVGLAALGSGLVAWSRLRPRRRSRIATLVGR